jgi:hypothetical protein
MKAIFAVAFLLLFSSRSQARIGGASSIEWLACKAEVIVIGKMTGVSTTKAPRSGTYKNCTVQIIEVIKGDVQGKELTFCPGSSFSEKAGKNLMNSKEGLLLFLAKADSNRQLPHLDGKYVPSMRRSLLVLDLSNIPRHVYSKEMTILTDRKEVVRLTRIWATSRVAHFLWSEVPMSSPITTRLYSGSSCFLFVPAEEKYRAHFLKLAQSGEMYERREAARELRKFPGKDTEAVLRELLKDESEFIWYSSADTISRVAFGVRVAAYKSLKALGKPVPDQILLEREPTEEEQSTLRQECWKKSFSSALSEGWKVVSVKDGPSRQIGERETTSVVVTCGEGEARCTFTLIPTEWAKEEFPAGVNLGINGRDNGGARHFFLEGALPGKVKEKLTKYFGLE